MKMIKKLLKLILVNSMALYAINQISEGFIFAGGTQTLLKTAAFLAIFAYLAKPVLKLLLLPINVITLGAVGSLLDVFGLYLAQMLIKGLEITNFYFPGFDYNGIIIPSFTLSTFASYIVLSFLLNLFIGIISWII